ncbi:major facilitator superfamily transporter [Phlyctema vagabunda]|uniref:Major facilitator superfamily transporter n=1 Tax=Phlyctema vagabunda TaxID=108571 RepID=A0ABR4P291_9HELO
MSGTVIGPAFGPCVGGILVTFTNWRAIFWMQTAMTGLGFVLSVLFVPSITSKAELFRQGKLDVVEAVGYFNPLRVFRLFAYPNILLTHIACGFLSWSQYSLLTAPRTLINPRFHLTTPLVSGLFYIAPGAGFLAGTICGGKFADITVRRHIKIRGYRLPQDRLNSGMIAFAFLVPVASLIYGWGLQYTVGGLALPIISIFWAGFGLMAAFSSLNTYCSEVLPAKRTEVITGKYFIQYLFSAGSSASILPLINSIGVGLATTIGAVLCLTAGALVLATARYGLDMQMWVDKKLNRIAKG